MTMGDVPAAPAVLRLPSDAVPLKKVTSAPVESRAVIFVAKLVPALMLEAT